MPENIDIKFFELTGSPIGEIYKNWGIELIENVIQAMNKDNKEKEKEENNDL